MPDLTSNSIRPHRSITVDSPPQSKVWLFALITIAASLVVLRLSPTVRYCSESIQEDCLPCPQHGSCDNNVLVCDQGFKPLNFTCVEDEEITNQARALLNKFSYLLRELKGQYICGNSDFDYITKAKLKEDIAESYPDKAPLLIAKIDSLLSEFNFDIQGD